SGGTLTVPVGAARPEVPAVGDLLTAYLLSQKHLVAHSTHDYPIRRRAGGQGQSRDSSKNSGSGTSAPRRPLRRVPNHIPAGVAALAARPRNLLVAPVIPSALAASVDVKAVRSV